MRDRCLAAVLLGHFPDLIAKSNYHWIWGVFLVKEHQNHTAKTTWGGTSGPSSNPLSPFPIDEIHLSVRRPSLPSNWIVKRPSKKWRADKEASLILSLLVFTVPGIVWVDNGEAGRRHLLKTGKYFLTIIDLAAAKSSGGGVGHKIERNQNHKLIKNNALFYLPDWHLYEKNRRKIENSPEESTLLLSELMPEIIEIIVKTPTKKCRNRRLPEKTIAKLTYCHCELQQLDAPVKHIQSNWASSSPKSVSHNNSHLNHTPAYTNTETAHVLCGKNSVCKLLYRRTQQSHDSHTFSH